MRIHTVASMIAVVAASGLALAQAPTDTLKSDVVRVTPSHLDQVLAYDLTPPELQCELYVFPLPGAGDQGGCTVPEPNGVINLLATDDSGEVDVHAMVGIGCDEIPVRDGQLVHLTWLADYDQPAEPRCFFAFLGDVLLIDAQHATLYAVATDPAGNESTCKTDLGGNDIGVNPDTNGDGDVDILDLITYLNMWYSCKDSAETTGDVPPDVNVRDLLEFIDVWLSASEDGSS